MINIRLMLNENLKKIGGHIGYSIRPTERQKGYNKVNLYLRKGIYDVNNNIEKTFLELNVPVAFTHYVCYSNYIDSPSSTDILDIWIKKKNGLYSVYINNKGGE